MEIGKHLTLEDIDNFVDGKALGTKAILKHIKTCEVCKEKLNSEVQKTLLKTAV